MTTPRPTPFHATTPRAGVFALFVIISDSGNKITTLPVIPTPPSPDHTMALYGCPLDSSDDSSDEDLKIPSLPSPPSAAVPPPPEYIESVGDDIETLRARVGSLEQYDVVTRESLRTVIGMITRSQLQALYVNQEVRELREFWVTDRFKMAELRSRAHDIEAIFWDLERHLGHRQIY
ncbi:hypothetical protein Tco_1191697 [Tanacetum coccineum]